MHLKITKTTVHDCTINISKVCSDVNANSAIEHMFFTVSFPLQAVHLAFWPWFKKEGGSDTTDIKDFATF